MDLSQPQSGTFGNGFYFSDLYLWALKGNFTGWVRIKHEQGESRATFTSGAPTSVTGPGVRTDHIGLLLAEINLCERKVVDDLVARQQLVEAASRPLIGQMLVHQGLLTPPALRKGLVHQTSRRFAKLFGLTGAEWESQPTIPEPLARYGQAIDGRSLVIPALSASADPSELESCANQLNEWAFKLLAPLEQVKAFGLSAPTYPVAKLLLEPRRLCDLESFFGNQKAVRAIARALVLCELVEPVDPSLAVFPTHEAVNAPEALPMAALTELPAPPPPTPMAFSSQGSSQADIFGGLTPDLSAPTASSPSLPIATPPPAKRPQSSNTPLGFLPATDASQPILETMSFSSSHQGTPTSNRIPARPKVLRPRSGSLGRIRTSVRRRNDVPVHMKLIVDELSALEEKIERGDPYALLGVGGDAAIDQIKSAHRKLSSRFNPKILSSQLPADLTEVAHRVYAALEQAKDELTQPTNQKKTQKQEKVIDQAAAAAQKEELERKFKMGKVLLSQREYHQARELFQSCMDADRYSGLFRAYYGWAIYSDPAERDNNGAERAFEVIREASLLEPNEVIIQVYYGQLLREKGELSHAASVLRRVLKADPNNSAARRELNAIKLMDDSIKVDIND
ncbi:MAG: hypothetical protein VYC39_10180 [Myxococcota bacterium]|nr:hypothetical protein [Myxococcota bacterium]